ncbi:MAG TPA: hypothetical protein PKZ32_05975 [Candidatus Melainabacteria bacterium]|nr:hypothetical protein [Candidatus Melainabacteria bacterium]
MRVIAFDDFGGTGLSVLPSVTVLSVTGRVEWKNKPIKHKIVVIAQKAIKIGKNESRLFRLCAMNGIRARYFLSTVVNMGGFPLTFKLSFPAWSHAC